MATSARANLLTRLRRFPAYVDSIGYQAIKVKRMKERKRAFLSEIFKRELEIMIAHYSSKSQKKTGKKFLQKLQKVKGVNLERMLDSYFNDVCFAFYKRQM